MRYRVGNGNMLIAYCSTEHILADFYTKALQGALFVNFCEVIMVWKHIDTLSMVPPSTKESVENVEEVNPIKRQIKNKWISKRHMLI